MPSASAGAPEIIRDKRHSRLFRFRMRRQVSRVARAPAAELARQLDEFSASLGGSLPAPGGSGTILAGCNDLYYRNFAVTLLLSLERQGAAQPVHLHLHTPSRQMLDHIERLGAALRNVRLSWTLDPSGPVRALRYPTVYFTAARFILAALLLERTGSPVLCIDVDGLATRPIWPAYEAFRTAGDVGLILRPERNRPWYKVLAAAVGLNPTPAGLAFAGAAGASMLRILAMRPSYHIDQIVLHYLAEEQRRLATPARIFDMPLAFCDHEFSPGGVIWTAKGWKTKTADVYQARKSGIDAAYPSLATL